jgi:hypothetical protein
LRGFSVLGELFDCADRHLNDGGVLVFDTYTASTLKMMAGTPKIVQQFGENYGDLLAILDAVEQLGQRSCNASVVSARAELTTFTAICLMC